MKRTLGTIFCSILLLFTLSGCLRGRLRDRLPGESTSSAPPSTTQTSPTPTASAEPANPMPDSFWLEWDRLVDEADSWLAPEPTVAGSELP
jgi:hypothetical protein